MKAWLIVLIALLVLAVLGFLAYFLFCKKPDLSSFLPLKEPRITRMEAQRVLQVKFSGPADSVIQKAYSVLFKAYYGLKGVPKGPGMKSPKARYDFRLDARAPIEERTAELKKLDWSGEVAIPLPEGLSLAPLAQTADLMKAQVANWDYGEVAEILHLGPYETEPATIQKLEDFITSRGYSIIGQHEEEYLRGPGMPFVTPKDYWTIIRYRIAKATP